MLSDAEFVQMYARRACSHLLPAAQRQRSSSGDALFMLDEAESCHGEGRHLGGSDVESVTDLCYEWQVNSPWVHAIMLDISINLL